ncbi:MAG: matrixin family metalloprotease [Cyanobacteria bacterium SZAS LIN-2]|nr:matrixin family metalloprotease [Cyanobacteria bacterium SZAS LIN-2]
MSLMLAAELIIPMNCCQARHDDFLFGAAPNVKTWDSDLPGEGSIAGSALVVAQARTIAALYLAPVVLADGEAPALLRARAAEALALLPKYRTMPKPLPPGEVNTKPVVPKKRSEQVTQISIPLADSLRFLRWRLQYFVDGKDAVKKEIADYLAQRNAEASKTGTILFGDLLALSLDYGRQESFLNQENLERLSHGFTSELSSQAASKADLEAVKKYEEDVARAYTFYQLDRREEASKHFGEAIAYLRPRPVAQRPQTDRLRKDLLRVLDVDLAPYEGADKKSATAIEIDRSLLKRNINYLIDIAYLAKLDGRLSEAAYLFRRAYLLIDRYLPAQMKDYTSLTYDLGETLLWDEKFDDSVYYLGLSARARAEAQPHSVTAIDTNNLLGRARLSQGQAHKAMGIFFDNLISVAVRSKFKGAKLDFKAPVSRSEQDVVIAALRDHYVSADADARRQIDDGLQGVVDAALPLKQYDLALGAGEALLAVRSKATPVVDATMMSVLWGLAYTCDSCARPEQAAEYYTRLIDSHGASSPAMLAYWYHGRGISYDQINRHDLAKKDIDRAIALYEQKRRVEEDDEARDHLYWTIEDLRWNLKMARRYPLKNKDYADLADNCRWRLSSFPLKVYVDGGRERGFGGELMDMVREAFAVWTDYKGSPVKIEYVDKLEKADVFIERVTVYDDIPYGSAGRTSATYERKGEADTKVLTRTHVRVYCPSYDGNDWERQDVKMSSFAKIQIKYLLVHELGHVLGLAHSPAGPDVMYWKSCAQKLSERDMNTINKIYAPVGRGAKKRS